MKTHMGSCMKGIGIGMTMGLGIAAASAMAAKNKKSAKPAGRAMHAVGDIIENVSHMFK